jgi:hypothetical protein
VMPSFQVFWPKIFFSFLFSLVHVTVPTHLIHSLISLIIFGEQYEDLLIMQCSSAFYYFLFHSSRYFP